MSEVLFVSDLHLGHRRIHELTAQIEVPGAFRGGTTVQEHDDWIIERMLSVSPTKKTLWYIMGDVAFNDAALLRLLEVPGRKRMVFGNHDELNFLKYLGIFEAFQGGKKEYGFWLTHMPIHPLELRGIPNLHGHCHHHTIREDPRYFNCAIEWLPNQRPVSLDWLRTNWEALRESH